MTRKVYAEILVDDSRAIREHKGTLDYVENKLESIENEGIQLSDYALLDEDSTDEWERYCAYLASWVFMHSLEEYKGMSPASFEEWRDMEDAY